jgi:FMN-dependent NADH-azoreductase
MASLLHLDASVRGERSLSRRLSQSFVDTWLDRHPADELVRRDLSEHAPPFVDESWIAACFTKPEARTPAMNAVLAPSDELIGELEAADVLVIGTPMFNYGMPARLKAWIDQVVRVDRTFSFDLARGDWPLEPILSGKALVLLTSCGEFGFGPGGEREEMNHLDTHLRVAGRYLGTAQSFHIGIEYQEFGDDRHARSLADALAAVPPLVSQVDEFIATRSLPAKTR